MIAEIAERTGRSFEAVKSRLSQIRALVRPGAPSPDVCATMRSMRWDGVSHKDIGAAVGRSASAVKDWCFHNSALINPELRHALAAQRGRSTREAREAAVWAARATRAPAPKVKAAVVQAPAKDEGTPAPAGVKVRPCMSCRAPIRSQHAGHRMCGRCRIGVAAADLPYAL